MPTASDTRQFYEGLGLNIDEDYWLNSAWAHETDDEKLAERINNDLQNLWRSAVSAGVSSDHPAMAFIDRTLQEWQTFYDDYRSGGSSLMRAWDPFDLWTEYHDDLMRWAERMSELVQRLPTLMPDPRQRQQVEVELERRGVPERAEEYGRTARGEEGLSSRTKRLLLGFTAVGGLFVAGIWVATKRRR